jgi:hypothetical protein
VGHADHAVDVAERHAQQRVEDGAVHAEQRVVGEDGLKEKKIHRKQNEFSAV